MAYFTFCCIFSNVQMKAFQSVDGIQISSFDSWRGKVIYFSALDLSKENIIKYLFV